MSLPERGMCPWCVWMDKWEMVWSKRAMCSCASGGKNGLKSEYWHTPLQSTHQAKPTLSNTINLVRSHTASGIYFRTGLYLKNTDPPWGTNVEGCRVMTVAANGLCSWNTSSILIFRCKQGGSCSLSNIYVMWNALSLSYGGIGLNNRGLFGEESSVVRKGHSESSFRDESKSGKSGSETVWPKQHIISTAMLQLSVPGLLG